MDTELTTRIKDELLATWDRVGMDLLGFHGGRMTRDQLRATVPDYMGVEDKGVIEPWFDMDADERDKLFNETFKDTIYTM